MAFVAHAFSGIVGVSTIALITVFHVWVRHDMRMLPLYAILGALLAVLLSYLFEGRAIDGALTVFGGAICGLMAEPDGFPSPEPLLTAAAIGGAIWVLLFCCQSGIRLYHLRRSQNELAVAPRERVSTYLKVSLISLLGAPFLGTVIFFLNYSTIHPMDRFFWCSRLAGVFTVGGLTLGVPYLLVWLMAISQESVRRKLLVGSREDQ